MAAAPGNDDALDCSFAHQAGLALASVNPMLQLEESFLAFGIDVIRNRRSSDERAHGTHHQSPGEQQHVLGQDDREEMAAAVADRAEQRELPAPLEHISQDDGTEADDADQQTEAAERLERREVRVLDRVELREPRRRRDGVGADVDRPARWRQPLAPRDPPAASTSRN